MTVAERVLSTWDLRGAAARAGWRGWNELWESGRGHRAERERLVWPRWPRLSAPAPVVQQLLRRQGATVRRHRTELAGTSGVVGDTSA